MKLSAHKTKIVCTIGPSCRSLAMIEELMKSGMNVARLNFSHGDFLEHKENIHNVRTAAAKLKQIVSILIDLPGVKMRIGKLKSEPIVLKKGQKVTLTTENVLGTAAVIPIEYKQLVKSAKKGGIIYLNDGFIQLRVESISRIDITCRIVIGGTLYSHKGINLPGAQLFVNAVTKRDLKMIEFGLSHGVSVFGISFVEKAQDIIKVREFAKRRGKTVYLVAKIERREAIVNFDEILKEADAVMIARGDLGIETPTEDVPVIQKMLIRKANVAGRPVITATQMLGSMTQNIRPTRAEVNDVANAILDGTDAVMLSEETAMGEYPIDAVNMMSKVAVSAERLLDNGRLSNEIRDQVSGDGTKAGFTVPDVISLNAVRAADKLNARYILSPTSSGNTARRVSRFKVGSWILSFSNQKIVCEFLVFSYGVQPFLVKRKSSAQPRGILRTLRGVSLIKKGDTAIIIERRISDQPGETDSLGILEIK